MLERRIKNMERTIALHNGVKMPIIGFGTWLAWILLVCKGKSLSDALDIALETGYRHIDTAYPPLFGYFFFEFKLHSASRGQGRPGIITFRRHKCHFNVSVQ
ncbi:Aldose reductase A [Trichinella sp. T8]|nr:Aldose reductase A [Trichinella sp. T8]